MWCWVSLAFNLTYTGLTQTPFGKKASASDAASETVKREVAEALGTSANIDACCVSHLRSTLLHVSSYSYEDASISPVSANITETSTRNALVLPFSQDQLPVAPNLNRCPQAKKWQGVVGSRFRCQYSVNLLSRLSKS